MEKDRFKRVMDVLDKIADPPYPNGGRQTWTFFIETNLLSSREPSKIFKCSSAKQIVTSTELHEIVKAHLPQEYHFYQILCAPPGYPGYHSLYPTTDLSKIQDFYCYFHID